MGKFANVGEPEVVLMEEMAEAIQLISKKLRFGGWGDVPSDAGRTRWAMLCDEMRDVFYQWDRLRNKVDGEIKKQPFTLNGDMAEQFNSQDYTGSWD